MLSARQIDYFVAVAQAGSLSKAALALGVSQPALTKQIRLIEEQLRLRVFERTGRGVRLTSAGQTVLEFAASISEQFERLEEGIARLRDAPTGTVALATTPLVAHVVTSPVAFAARATLPHVQLKVMEGFGAGVTQWVADGRADIAVSYIPLTQVRHLIDGEALLDDQMVLLGPPALFEARGIGPRLRFAELERLPLVLPTQQSGQRRWLDRVARERGFAFSLRLEIDSLTALLDVVVLGHGFTILPQLAVSAHLRQGSLSSAAIMDPEVPAQLTIYTARGRNSSGMEKVAALVKTQARLLERDLGLGPARRST